MDERIDFVAVQGRRRAEGISLAVAASLVLHALMLIVFLRGYRPAAAVPDNAPIARYVELMKQNPREFTEAPGPAVETAPLNAPLSDANRKARSPDRTGDQLTTRPGDGTGGPYTPPSSRAARSQRPQVVESQEQAAEAMNAAPAGAASQPQQIDADQLVFRQPAAQSANAAAGVDWRSAIREVGKVASLGGDGLDLGKIGGDKGFTAEQGPLSFETQWYDWGAYAQSMVSRIRVNWYSVMPELIRTGMKGVVTIRFTIHRNGRISDVTVLKSSGVPPYDFAAKRAIEASSPLNPLPKDFPNDTERVTCMFYYNMDIR